MISASKSFAIHEIINRYFKNDQDARLLVQEIEQVIDDRFQSEKSILATKSDISEIRIEIKDTKAELLKWMIILFAPFYVGLIVFLVKQFL